MIYLVCGKPKSGREYILDGVKRVAKVIPRSSHADESLGNYVDRLIKASVNSPHVVGDCDPVEGISLWAVGGDMLPISMVFITKQLKPKTGKMDKPEVVSKGGRKGTPEGLLNNILTSINAIGIIGLMS